MSWFLENTEGRPYLGKKVHLSNQKVKVRNSSLHGEKGAPCKDGPLKVHLSSTDDERCTLEGAPSTKVHL